VQREQKAAREQILKFKEKVEEELYESDSDGDDECIHALLATEEEMAHAAAEAATTKQRK
jgi:hypothetical protein